jgi:hypothetical protein
VSDAVREALRAIVTAELAAPAAPEVVAVADAARARHGRGVCAVLFYGSCRRDGYRDGLLVDLYLIVDGYRAVHSHWLMRVLNRLVPPNVYYLETCLGDAKVRAKYALVDLGQLERLVSARTLNPYFWARFAQPTGLMWAREPAVAPRLAMVMVESILTTDDAVRPLAGVDPDALTLWTCAFAESYRTELRAEKPERAGQIVAGDPARYQKLTAALGARRPAMSARRAARLWFWRRLQGKLLSLLRLAKASYTFAGGADYLAWKISRHAGAQVEFTPWQRRHPLLAAPLVFWRLTRRGIVR